MAYVKKIPPIKLYTTIDEYNELIGILNSNFKNFSSTEEKYIANITKDKLLKYSIPKNIDGSDLIEIRLYINEAIDILSQLLLFSKKIVVRKDYYSLLIENRKKNELNDLEL